MKAWDQPLSSSGPIALRPVFEHFASSLTIYFAYDFWLVYCTNPQEYCRNQPAIPGYLPAALFGGNSQNHKKGITTNYKCSSPNSLHPLWRRLKKYCQSSKSHASYARRQKRSGRYPARKIVTNIRIFVPLHRKRPKQKGNRKGGYKQSLGPNTPLSFKAIPP